MMWKVNTWTLERGGDAQILVHLLDLNSNPLNISGASQINLLLKNADGSQLTISQYGGIACGLFNTLWIYEFALTAAQTDLLPLYNAIPVSVQVFWGTENHQIFELQSSFSTIDPVVL